jgi:hypothetical protein
MATVRTRETEIDVDTLDEMVAANAAELQQCREHIACEISRELGKLATAIAAPARQSKQS